MMLTIILFSFAEADQHDNVRQAAVCKRRRFNGVVSPRCMTQQVSGIIIFSLHAYLVEIAMLC